MVGASGVSPSIIGPASFAGPRGCGTGTRGGWAEACPCASTLRAADGATPGARIDGAGAVAAEACGGKPGPTAPVVEVYGCESDGGRIAAPADEAVCAPGARGASEFPTPSVEAPGAGAGIRAAPAGEAPGAVAGVRGAPAGGALIGAAPGAGAGMRGAPAGEEPRAAAGVRVAPAGGGSIGDALRGAWRIVPGAGGAARGESPGGTALTGARVGPSSGTPAAGWAVTWGRCTGAWWRGVWAVAANSKCVG